MALDRSHVSAQLHYCVLDEAIRLLVPIQSSLCPGSESIAVPATSVIAFNSQNSLFSLMTLSFSLLIVAGTLSAFLSSLEDSVLHIVTNLTSLVVGPVSSKQTHMSIEVTSVHVQLECRTISSVPNVRVTLIQSTDLASPHDLSHGDEELDHALAPTLDVSKSALICAGKEIVLSSTSLIRCLFVKTN